VADGALLRRTSLDLVRSVYPPETGIRLVGVTVSNFEPAREETTPSLPLFA
jgi:DNA polymerase-4